MMTPLRCVIILVAMMVQQGLTAVNDASVHTLSGRTSGNLAAYGLAALVSTGTADVTRLGDPQEEAKKAAAEAKKEEESTREKLKARKKNEKTLAPKTSTKLRPSLNMTNPHVVLDQAKKALAKANSNVVKAKKNRAKVYKQTRKTKKALAIGQVEEEEERFLGSTSEASEERADDAVDNDLKRQSRAIDKEEEQAKRLEAEANKRMHKGNTPSKHGWDRIQHFHLHSLYKKNEGIAMGNAVQGKISAITALKVKKVKKMGLVYSMAML